MEIAAIKQTFLRYILVPLIMVLMIFVLSTIRKGISGIKLKHIILYVLLGVFSLAIPGFLGFSGNLFNPYWYLFAMVVYLTLGIFHVNLLHRYFRKHFDSLPKGMLFEIILTLICLLGGGFLFTIIFRWIGNDMGEEYMAATSAVIFIAPLVYYYCYLQFISIPSNIYKTWQYDPEQIPHNFKGIDFDRLMVLNVELGKNVGDGQRFNIKAKTLPTGLTFGDWFLRVLDDYNFKNPASPIKLHDENGQPYYWIFYVKKSFFNLRKYIDFEKEINPNKLTENETIICKRVLNYSEEKVG